MNRLPYAQRLNRDVSELFSHNFNCSSSTLTVIQTSDSLQGNGSLIIQINIFEGPYRGGCYVFGLNIPEGYPFRPVEIYATQPIWHPNIDLFTGRVALPMEWSPVLTLNSLALAVQMLLLEPSSENPLNMDAFSYYISQSDTFEQLVQKSIYGGCTISGVKFSTVLIPDERVQVEEMGDSSSTDWTPDHHIRIEEPDSSSSSSGQSGNHSSLLQQRPSTPYNFASMSSTSSSSRSVSTNMEGCSPLPTGLSASPHGSGSVEMSRSSSVVSNLAGMGESMSNDCLSGQQGSTRSTSTGGGLASSSATANTVGIGMLSRKRALEQTESSMELETLERNAAASLVHGSRKDPFTTAAGEETGALEDWNHRIAAAYSQLSLGTHPHPAAGATTGSTLPPRSTGYSNSSSSSNNYIGSPGQHGVFPDRLQQQQSAVTGSHFHPIHSNNLHAHIVHSSSNMPSHHSPSIERLSAGLSSGMEVCSPFKKVKFSMEL